VFYDFRESALFSFPLDRSVKSFELSFHSSSFFAGFDLSVLAVGAVMLSSPVGHGADFFLF